MDKGVQISQYPSRLPDSSDDVLEENGRVNQRQRWQVGGCKVEEDAVEEITKNTREKMT